MFIILYRSSRASFQHLEINAPWVRPETCESSQAPAESAPAPAVEATPFFFRSGFWGVERALFFFWKLTVFYQRQGSGFELTNKCKMPKMAPCALSHHPNVTFVIIRTPLSCRFVSMDSFSSHGKIAFKPYPTAPAVEPAMSRLRAILDQ